MKATIIILLFSVLVSAQNKQINFFGTTFSVNKECEVSDKSVTFKKDALVWLDAPPESFYDMITSTMTSKLEEKNWKPTATQELKITLVKTSWKGKMLSYKKENSDSIANIVQLTGSFNKAERMLIIVYKTPKKTPFRIPAAFSFLVK